MIIEIWVEQQKILKPGLELEFIFVNKSQIHLTAQSP